MSRPRGFIRDPAGVMVPPGQVRRTLTETFLQGTMASWLTATSGTQTFSALSSSRCYTQLATAASSGASAQLSAPAISLASVEGILFEVDGLSFDASGVAMDVILGINGGGQVGGYAKQASGAASFTLYTGSTNTAANYNIRDSGEGILRHNIGLLLLPPSKELLLMQDQQVVGYRDGLSSWNYGTATPNVQIITQSAAARSMQIEQVRLTIWTN